VKFFVIVICLIYSNVLFANKALNKLESLNSYNDHEPLIISDRFLENAGMKKLPLTEDEKRKIFRAKLESKNESFVRKSIELIRIQNEIEIMNNLENAIHKVKPKPKKAFFHTHLTK
jgi:hypothetical protein